MRTGISALLALSLVASGCASTDMMPRLGGAGAAPSAITGETFEFRPVQNADVSISISRATIAGQPDFLPGDPNWVQLHMAVENRGQHPISVTQVQIRLVDGRTLRSASGAQELMKPPSFVASTAANVGIGTAGMLVGAFLFPPAAIVGGLAMVFMPMFSADRLQARLAELDSRSLRAEAVVPGSYVDGLVFVPAVTGIDQVVVVYSRDGAARSVFLERVATTAAVVPDSTGDPQPPQVAQEAMWQVRTTATLRAGPGTSSESLQVLRSPATVVATGRRENGWLEVRDERGVVGWVLGTLLVQR